MTVRENIKVFLVIFFYTLLLDLVVRQLLLPELMPALHAGLGFMTGDSIGYHEFAAEIAKRIRSEGWGVWQLRPGSDIFVLAAPSGIASAIYATFGTNPLLLLPFNAAVHAASAVLLLGMLQALFQDKKASFIATLPFILFPTAISWHSQLLKDGLFILGIYAYLASWIMAAKFNLPLARRFPVIFLLASMGLVVIWAVRPYMLAVLASTTIALGVFLILWTIAQRRNTDNYMLRIVEIALLAGCLLAVGYGVNKTDTRPGMSQWTGQELKNSVYVGRPLGNSAAVGDSTIDEAGVRRCKGWTDSPAIPAALSRLASKIVIVRGGYYDEVYAGAGSTIDREVCITSFWGLVAYIPRAMQIGLLAPFPDQWVESGSHGGGASRLIVGLEMLFSYVALFALFYFGRRLFSRPEFWLLLAFAVSMIVLYALVTPNLGALHRMRYGFLMILVGMGLALGLTRYRPNTTQA